MFHLHKENHNHHKDQMDYNFKFTTKAKTHIGKRGIILYQTRLFLQNKQGDKNTSSQYICQNTIKKVRR